MFEALGKPVADYQKFHNSSMLKAKTNISKTDKTILLKEYLRLEKLILDKVKLSKIVNSNSKDQIVKDHKSIISVSTISNVLSLSGGIQKNSREIVSNFYLYKGQYAVETYLYSIDTDLPRGFYHYNPLSHTLDILPFKKNKFIKKILKYKNQPKLIILISGVFERLTNLVQDRGYLLVLKEVGYFSQNILINANSYGLETEIVEDFSSQEIDSDLDLDSMRESVLEVIILK